MLDRGPLAPFACDPRATRGRLFAEPESTTRSVFQRDRDRIIHAGAFRRLKHKTQVFVAHYGDYYRTRLTHSIEVSQIARSLARTLGLDEDLAEAVALAHDLGHPPFGHAGERVLKECMEGFGGFDHNAQTLVVVTSLEQRYAEFDGLNLTWECLEGIAKHNGPLIRSGVSADLPDQLSDYLKKQDLEVDTYASAEAQVAAISDDIAYNNHDLDDGLRANLLSVDDLRELPMVGDVLKDVLERYPGLAMKRVIQETIRRLITLWVNDVLTETTKRVSTLSPANANDIRRAPRPIVTFSDAMREDIQVLRDFLFTNMYRHFEVERTMHKAEKLLRDMFGLLFEKPNLLPDTWSRQCEGQGEEIRARVICNYIAGMTDRFAMQEHRRLFELRIDV